MANIPQETKDYFLNPPPIVTRGGKLMVKEFRSFLTEEKNKTKAAAYGLLVKRFLNWCEVAGVSCLPEITNETMASYLGEISKQFSPAYFNFQVSAIRSMFSWLMSANCLKANPASAVIRKKIDSAWKLLMRDEIEELLDTVSCASFEDLRDRAITAIAIFAFGNTAAISLLNRDDYHYVGNSPWLRIKSDDSYCEIPVNTQLERYIQEYILARDNRFQTCQPLFVATRGLGLGQRISHRGLQRGVKRWSRRAGFTDYVLIRSLRASGLSHYLSSGGTVEKARILARHKFVGSTARYGTGLETTIVYEGDLDGLMAYFGDAVSSPLLEHYLRAGTFRLSVITGQEETATDAASEE